MYFGFNLATAVSSKFLYNITIKVLSTIPVSATCTFPEKPNESIVAPVEKTNLKFFKTLFSLISRIEFPRSIV